MEQEERLCDGVEAVGELTYLGDRVCAGRGCCSCLKKLWLC